ncbi:MAG TPA: acetate kinase [Candidatus Deferrimicrobiaceae bacterium]|nr:acetate kinase [Candidatus Deferrimicrobiaceae bacterium]
MNVLAFNCGSSSVKFLAAEMDPEGTAGRSERVRARGIVERIGGDALLSFRLEGGPPARMADRIVGHEEAIRRIFAWIDSARGSLFPDGPGGIDAIGHRVVHGGRQFTRTTRIDESVTEAIDSLEEMAPLHNPPSIAGIRAARAAAGKGIPMVAVFDTSFHASLPDCASLYAIPYELSTRHGIRRYGFHGISYQYLLSRYCTLTETPPGEATLVAFHLGNGCSAAAIRKGASVDTSMGFTPLEGLVMGTRSGDIDPAVFGLLESEEGLPPREVENLLNRRSGLLGLSGISRDMRDLLGEGNVPRARLAVEIFCYRARKFLGAYLAALGGAEAIVFSGGIGENAPEIRARILEGMEWFGIRIDPDRNRETAGREGEIGAPGSRVRLFVIPSDEEIVIARETAACLRRSR